MSTKKPEQGPTEGLESQIGKQQEQSPQNLQLDLVGPDSSEFLELRCKLIEQSGCPDIEQSPAEYAEWLETAHTLREYLGHLAMVGKVDPYGLLQKRDGGINDLAMLAKAREGDSIVRAFAYIKEQTGSDTPRIKLNQNRAYNESEINNLSKVLSPRSTHFIYGRGLENCIDIYLQLDSTQIQSLIDYLKKYLKAVVKEEAEAGDFRIAGDEPLEFRILQGAHEKENFWHENAGKITDTFVPSVDVRPLAYGIRHHDIPDRPFTEPPVNGLYKKPAVLKTSDLDAARCDRQILILLATLNQAKVPTVLTFRSGGKIVANLENDTGTSS